MNDQNGAGYENSWKQRPKTAAEFAYRELYRRVINGDLAPGEKINQDAEAERLQLSRMPIREALRRLASDGFVIIQPHRGAIVRPLSVDDLNDLYLLRLELEGAAGRVGTTRIDAGGIETMESLFADMYKVQEHNRIADWLDVDWRFHCVLYAAAGSKRMYRLILQLREEAKRYRLLALGLPNEVKISIRDHYDLMEHVRQGDGPAVEANIKHSMLKSQDKLINLLSNHVDVAEAVD